MDIVDFKSVINKVNKLPQKSEVTLSGGEPGLLTPYEVKILINKLKEKECDIDLLTNGTFMDKHLEWIDDILVVLYHCVEELTDCIKYPNLNQDKFIYVLVVTVEDIESGKLKDFMDRYSSISFMLSPNKLLLNNSKIYNIFNKFYKEHKEQLHPRTYSEFIKNMVRR